MIGNNLTPIEFMEVHSFVTKQAHLTAIGFDTSLNISTTNGEINISFNCKKTQASVDRPLPPHTNVPVRSSLVKKPRRRCRRRKPSMKTSEAETQAVSQPLEEDDLSVSDNEQSDAVPESELDYLPELEPLPEIPGAMDNVAGREVRLLPVYVHSPGNGDWITDRLKIRVPEQMSYVGLLEKIGSALGQCLLGDDTSVSVRYTDGKSFKSRMLNRDETVIFNGHDSINVNVNLG